MNLFQHIAAERKKTLAQRAARDAERSASLQAANKTEEEKRRIEKLAAERVRTAREKYKMKEIARWTYIGPALMFVAALVVGTTMWISHTQLLPEHYWFFGVTVAPLLLIGITDEVEKEWMAALSAKRELSNQVRGDGSYYSKSRNYDDNYDFEYVYTDSLFGMLLYQFAKISSVTCTIAVGLAAAFLMFMWLGTITIAPTTIIIILLLIIIFNQNSRK